MNLQKESSEYSHTSDPNRLHIIRLRNEIKIPSASSDEGASMMLSDVLCTTPLAVIASLPSTKALLQTVCREEKPIYLNHNGLLPLMSREIDRDENFVPYKHDSMIIFTCENNPSVLQECRHVLMDGMFNICLFVSQPSIDQIFTLRSVQKVTINYLLFIGCILIKLSNLVYALLIAQETNDLNKFF